MYKKLEHINNAFEFGDKTFCTTFRWLSRPVRLWDIGMGGDEQSNGVVIVIYTGRDDGSYDCCTVLDCPFLPKAVPLSAAVSLS